MGDSLVGVLYTVDRVDRRQEGEGMAPAVQCFAILRFALHCGNVELFYTLGCFSLAFLHCEATMHCGVWSHSMQKVVFENIQ